MKDMNKLHAPTKTQLASAVRGGERRPKSVGGIFLNAVLGLLLAFALAFFFALPWLTDGK